MAGAAKRCYTSCGTDVTQGNVAALRYALPEVELISTSRNGGGNKSVAWNVCRRVFYSHKWAIFLATWVATKLRDRLHEKLPSVT